jgi:chromosome partitioning protein
VPEAPVESTSEVAAPAAHHTPAEEAEEANDDPLASWDAIWAADSPPPSPESRWSSSRRPAPASPAGGTVAESAFMSDPRSLSLGDGAHSALDADFIPDPWDPGYASEAEKTEKTENTRNTQHIDEAASATAETAPLGRSGLVEAAAAPGLDAEPYDFSPQPADAADAVDSASLITVAADLSVDPVDTPRETPQLVDEEPPEPVAQAETHPQSVVDDRSADESSAPADILFGPSPAPFGMGAMTAAQIAARTSSDDLSRRLLETPIASATERTLLVTEGRTMGRDLPLPPVTRIFVVANQKGGVGKTTTAVNVAAGLALYGARVLVIDLDPQGNASTALGIEHSEGTPGVYEAMIDGTPISDLVVPCEDHPGIIAVPASIDLAGAEIELVSIVARENRLKNALNAYLTEMVRAGTPYHYVFIDCPPSLGLLTVNALTAAREVLVPIQSEYYALEGLSQLLRHIDMVKAHLNPGLDVSTILLTMYDARTKLAGEVAAEVRGHFRDRVLRTAVPRSVRISEAPSHGKTVLAYDPTSAGALSYLEASREIAMRNAS